MLRIFGENLFYQKRSPQTPFQKLLLEIGYTSMHYNIRCRRCEMPPDVDAVEEISSIFLSLSIKIKEF